MHEIVTIQFGQRANHVATHFWNTQESYFTYDDSAAPSPVNHDVNWRPGINRNGDETFTPRTLIYDLKGGFGGLQKWGGLYDQELSMQAELKSTKQGVWDGTVALQQDPTIQQVEYQRGLEEGHPRPDSLTTETVRYWSDYNRVFYHPRSIIQLNEYDLNSSLMPFEKYETGQELFDTLHKEEDFLDRDLRLWVEECDQMQGFQILAGSDDAWAGLSSSYLESLRDEFGKLSIWMWGVGDDQAKGSSPERVRRTLNMANFTAQIFGLASLYIPMSIPSSALPHYVNLERQSQWHTSAIISAAMETVTLPSRLRSDGGQSASLVQLESAVNVNGNQRFAQLQCSLSEASVDKLGDAETEEMDERLRSKQPLGSNPESSEVEDLDMDMSGLSEAKRVSGQALGQPRVFGAVECFRGPSTGTVDKQYLAARSDVPAQSRFTEKPIVSRYYSTLGYPIPDSFPPILTDAKVGKASGVASIRTSTKCRDRLLALKKSATYAPSSERETLRNSLDELAEAYMEGFDEASDYDSDD